MEIDEFLDQQIGKMKTAQIEELPDDVKAALGKGASGIRLGSAITEEPKETAAKQPELKREARISGGDDIDSLIAQANAMIAKGDFEGARQIYLVIKGMKKGLPQMFAKQDEKISGGLVDLNERIAEGFEKTLTTEFNEKFGRINRLLNEAYSCITGDRISNLQSLNKVDEIYRQIKQLHLEFPEGYVEKRVMIEDQMLRLYRIIIMNRKTLLYDDFGRKSREILELMGLVANEIGKGSYENASKLFSKVTKLYRELPKGFLREKTDLQGKILDIYQKLVIGRESSSYTEFENKAAELKGLFSQAYSFVKNDDMKGAMDAYKQISEMYAKLPAGYFSKKSEIEIEMMELYHIISLKKDKSLLEETRAKVNEIESLIQSSSSYLVSRELDLAKETYDEIIAIYNSMPEGFFDEKVKVQAKLIKLYKGLLANMHELIFSEQTRGDKARYDELIRLLVDMHTHIMRKEFTEIKNKYLAAYKLYHELPLGLIEEKKSIYGELYKTYEELRLYTTVEKLAELADSSQYKEMADMLDAAAEEYNMLSKKYPQDIELFKYLQSKCLLYLDRLKKVRDEKQDKTALDVRRKIEEVAAAKEELKGELPVNAPQGQQEQAQ